MRSGQDVATSWQKVVQKPAPVLWGLLTIYGLVLANAVAGGLRLTNVRLNLVFFAVMMLIPPLCVGILAAAQRTILRIVLSCLLILLSLISGALALIALDFLAYSKGNHESDLKYLCAVPLKGKHVFLYQKTTFKLITNIQVRQEHPILPGVIWLETLYTEEDNEEKAFGAHPVTVDVLDDRHFRCKFLHERDGTVSPHTVIVTAH